MNFDDIKSNWKNTGSTKKSQSDLLLMTRIKSHPQLKRIRIQLIIETIFLAAFLVLYYNLFDGHQKPLWVNLLLISSAVLFLLNDIIGWINLYNPIKEGSLKVSLAKFQLSLQRLSIFSSLSSLIFGSSIILFFSVNLDLSQEKYFILTGMIITMLVLIYFATINWKRRINHIGKTIADLDADTF